MKLVKHRGKTELLPAVSSKWQPSWPLSRLQNQIEQLFNESFDWLGPLATPFHSWGPAVDVVEDKNRVLVKAELPGMKKEEIEVYITGGALNIAGERKEESASKSGGSVRIERYFGRFQRLVQLPAEVEAKKIEAHYKDGVLTISCPKTEEAKQKQIEVKIT
jgi:HSP20 family protein